MNSEFDPDTLDCFLEEMLSEKHPPDLRQSILNRLREISAEDAVRLDSVVAAALLDLEDSRSPKPRDSAAEKSADLLVERAVSEVRTFESDRTRVSIQSLDVEVRERSMAPASVRLQRWLWGAAGLVAASGLIMLGSWLSNRNSTMPGAGMVAENNSKEKAIEGSPNQSQTNILASDGSVKSDGNGELNRDNNQRKIASERNVLDSSRVPFENKVMPENDTVVASNNVVRPRKTLSDFEVIEAIDGQMQTLWANQDITLPESVESEGWIRRVTKLLLDRDVTDSELKVAGTLGTQEGRANFVYRMTLSREFAKRWSKALAKHWVADSGTDSSPERLAFEGWLEEQIFAGVPLRIVQQRMLAAVGSENAPNAIVQPESYWLSRLAGLDLQARVETYCRTQLGQNVACARCHDKDSAAGQSLISNGLPASQIGYWGTASILSQWTIQQDESKGSVLLRQEVQEQFYEKADGRMATAIPTAIDGAVIAEKETWSGIVSWTIAHPQRTRASVDFVWESLLGRALVPEYGLASSEGSLERKELREFLADQWSGKDEDLRQLVMWLSMSKPFAAKSSQETFQSYLAMSAEQQLQWRKRDRLFAQFVPLGGRSRADVGNETLRNLTEWFKSNRGIALGSPALSIPNATVSSSKSLFEKYGAGLERLVVHSQRIDESLEQQLASWNSSKTLSWEQKVEHASMLVGASGDQGELKRLAEELLSLSGGDPEVALRRMMAARSDL